MLAMVSLHSLMGFIFFRVGKERLGRRETLVHLELLDQPASAGLPGMMALRETLYVSSTNTRTQNYLMDKLASDVDSDLSAGSSWLPRRPWPPWRARHSCK